MNVNHSTWTLTVFNSCVMPSIDSTVIVYWPWWRGIGLAYTSSRSSYCLGKDKLPGVKLLRTVSAVHRSSSFKDVVGRGSVFLPEKKRKEGGISQPPETGEEIVIQQASDGCQAVLLHCRCDANVHSSFSSLCCVTPPKSPHPPPLPLHSTFLSFIFFISFPCLACCFLSLHASAHSLSISLSFSLFTLFTAFFIALCPPTSLFSPYFFFSLSSQQRWVGGVKHCALEIVVPSAFQTGRA